MLRIRCTILAVASMLSGTASAQEAYPTRAITMVVAFPPGGLADITARPVAAAMERILKQPVVVANKPGAAGGVGNHFVAASKPDGYTLVMALVSVSVLPEVDKLFGRPPTYTRDQLTGIARINADPSMLVVRADMPWKTAKDLVEDAKKRPNEIVFSSSGLYGAAHVPIEMFMHAAGIRMRHLPTTGGGPMMNAILGGHSQVTMTPASLAVAHVKAGKLKFLAHTGTAPVAAYPEVPPFKSLGYDVEYTAWAGLLAPKSTPPHVVKILRDAVRQAVKEPEVVNSHAKLETPIAYMDADEFNAWWAKDAARLAEVVRTIGKVLEPGIVDGQIHGAVVQGIPDALNEQLAYAAAGQRLTATLMDYTLATAVDAPRTFEIRHLESPTPLNPLGAKGAGEGGIMPVHPLLAQAIEDALAPFGARVTRVPVTREEICAMTRADARSQPG